MNPINYHQQYVQDFLLINIAFKNFLKKSIKNYKALDKSILNKSKMFEKENEDNLNDYNYLKNLIEKKTNEAKNLKNEIIIKNLGKDFLNEFNLPKINDYISNKIYPLIIKDINENMELISLILPHIIYNLKTSFNLIILINMAQDKEYQEIVAKYLLDEDVLKSEYKKKAEKIQNDNINLRQKINSLEMNERELIKKNDELQFEIEKNSLKVKDEIKSLNQKLSYQQIDLNIKINEYEDLEEKYNNLIISNKNILSNERNNQEKFTNYENEIKDLIAKIEISEDKIYYLKAQIKELNIKLRENGIIISNLKEEIIKYKSQIRGLKVDNEVLTFHIERNNSKIKNNQEEINNLKIMNDKEKNYLKYEIKKELEKKQLKEKETFKEKVIKDFENKIKEITNKYEQEREEVKKKYEEERNKYEELKKKGEKKKIKKKKKNKD